MSSLDYSKRLAKHKHSGFSTKTSFYKRDDKASRIRKSERSQLYASHRRYSIPPTSPIPTLLSKAELAAAVEELYVAITATPPAADNLAILQKLETIRNAMYQSVDFIDGALQASFLEPLKLCLQSKDEDIVSESVCCIAIMAYGSEVERQQVEELVPYLVERLKHSNLEAQEGAAIAIGNISLEFPECIIHSSALKHITSIMNTYLDSDCCDEAQGGLVRIIVWLLCNIFGSSHDVFTLTDLTFVTALCRLVQILITKQHILRNVFLGDATKYIREKEVSVGALSIQDDRRGIVGEALWCLTYLFDIPNIDWNKLFCTEEFVATLIRLIIDGIRSAADAHTTQEEGSKYSSAYTLPAFDNATSTEGALIHSPISTRTKFVAHFSSSMLTKHNTSRAEMLYPSLKLLNLMHGNEDTGAANLVVTAIANAPFIEMFDALILHDHRGIVMETVGLVVRLSVVDVSLVLPLLPKLAKLLKDEGNADIKRQTALCFVNVASSDGRKYLESIMHLQPSIALSMLESLDTCKRDARAVTLALDFLDIVLQYVPAATQFLYEHGAIEKMEGAQYEHDPVLERRISHMVSKYFDDIDEMDDQHNTGRLYEEHAIQQQLNLGP